MRDAGKDDGEARAAGIAVDEHETAVGVDGAAPPLAFSALAAAKISSTDIFLAIKCASPGPQVVYKCFADSKL